MKKLFALLLLLSSFGVQAKEISVIAFGEGENYDWAVLNAVENAVRQTNEISIEGNGLHKIDISSSISREQSQSGNSSSNTDATLNAKGEFGREGYLDAKGNVNSNNSYEDHKTDTIAAGVKDNSKHIPATYKGVVSSYEILEHGEEKGIHRVKIKALVNQACPAILNCATQKVDCSCYACQIGYKPVDKECLACDDKEVCGCVDGKKWSKEQNQCVYDVRDYKSKNLVKKADYSLAVLPFKATKQLNCLGKKVSIDELNTLITNAFVENLVSSRKFSLVDRNNLDNYADELSLIANDLTLSENKIRLKNIVPADYILVGTIENFSATETKEFIEFTGETSYESSSKLKLSYRILETATMEIVSSGSVEKKFSKDDAFSSCYNVEELLVGRVVKDASNKLLTDIFPDYKVSESSEAKKPAKKKAEPAQPVDYSLILD